VGRVNILVGGKAVAAYVLVQVTIDDVEGYEAYKQLTPETVARHGGRFVVRGGEVDVVEGEPPYERVVILEFDTLEQARRWYDSPEYTKARALRQAHSSGVVMLLDGIGLQ
jgi:uncharacterized protein (DUF1330 family)